MKQGHFDHLGRKIRSARSPIEHGTRPVSGPESNPPRWQASLVGRPATEGHWHGLTFIPGQDGYGLLEAARLESIHGRTYYDLTPSVTDSLAADDSELIP